jgi:hypothetical protein
MMWIVPVDKEAIPYRFDMSLNGVTWTFEMRYNSEHNFFTVDLYRGEESIAVGEKIVYGSPLFADEIPGIQIIPLDLSGNANSVGWNELGETVFLYLEGGEYGELVAESAGAGGGNVD